MGSPRLRDVLERIESAVVSDVLPLVVFDLDSTLFSTEPRNLQIFHEFVERRESYYRELTALARTIRREHMGWNICESLQAQGVDNVELLEELRRFWRDRFFTDQYVLHDDPVPGSVEFVTACHQRGALIYYLTGRHVGGMEVGTVQALRSAGFPFWRGRCTLHLKPSFEMSDRAFKDDALADIRSYHGRVVATFENEPGNANLFLKSFPDALHFLLLTVHSPEAEVPSSGLVQCEDFTLPPSRA